MNTTLLAMLMVAVLAGCQEPSPPTKLARQPCEGHGGFHYIGVAAKQTTFVCFDSTIEIIPTEKEPTI